MRAEKNMCGYELRASDKPVGLRVVIAFMLGLLAQYAVGNSCFADEGADPSTQSQQVAAMPEPGTPPSPVAADEAQESTPVPTDEPLEQAEPAASHSAASTSSQPSVAGTEVEVRELSVAPESKPLLPEGRPAWVGAPPDLSNPRRHRLFVGSFPSSLADEGDAALDEPMVAAVNSYIDEHLLEDGDAEDLHVTADFIRHNLLDRSTEYLAELSTSTGPLYQKWVVLEITPEHRKYFVDAHRQVEQKKRMVALGLGLVGVLGITGVAHLAFNRRRRHYGETVQPIAHRVHHEPEVDAAKRTGQVVWIIAGGTACLLVLGLLLAFGVTVVPQSRTTRPMTVNTSPQVIIHGQPPVPPTPPRAPEVYFEQAEMESMIQEQRQARRRLQEAKAAAEIQLGSDR